MFLHYHSTFLNRRWSVSHIAAAAGKWCKMWASSEVAWTKATTEKIIIVFKHAFKWVSKNKYDELLSTKEVPEYIFCKVHVHIKVSEPCIGEVWSSISTTHLESILTLKVIFFSLIFIRKNCISRSNGFESFFGFCLLIWIFILLLVKFAYWMPFYC